MSYKFSLKRRYLPEQSMKDRLLISDNIQTHYVPSFSTFQRVILSLLLAAYVLTTNPIFVVTDDSLRNYQHMILISLKQQKNSIKQLAHNRKGCLQEYGQVRILHYSFQNLFKQLKRQIYKIKKRTKIYKTINQG